MSVSMMFLWIVIAILLIAVVILARRLWQTSQAQAPLRSNTENDRFTPASRGDTPPVIARQPSATSPPASAGGYAGTGTQAPSRRAPAGATDRIATSRPRTSRPPPALAGDIPGVSISPSAATAHARSHGGTRPPPASAGGARRDDE